MTLIRRKAYQARPHFLLVKRSISAIYGASPPASLTCENTFTDSSIKRATVTLNVLSSPLLFSPLLSCRVLRWLEFYDQLFEEKKVEGLRQYCIGSTADEIVHIAA